MASRGIYFLANDRVFDWVVAFLNSLRAHNPSIPVCLIPYDNDTSRIRALQSTYDFEVFSDEEQLAACDAISLNFHEKVRGHYRKIAAWGGKYDEFIYIDIDTVVLRPVDFTFSLLKDYDVVVAHSNEPNSRQFVWKDSLPPDSGLTRDEIDYAANTGFILSRRSVFHAHRVGPLVEQAKRLAPHMDLQCFEQPLLNYLIVKSTSRYSSIRRMNEKSPAKRLPEECWPGDRAWKINVNGTSTYRGKTREILHVHWAGEMVPRGWESRMYNFLGRFGMPRPIMKLRVKQGHLWRHYRHLRRN